MMYFTMELIFIQIPFLRAYFLMERVLEISAIGCIYIGT